MTIEEFSNEFDVLLNSYIVNLPLGTDKTIRELDEYEKSVLLTAAQEAVVNDLYNGRLTGEGFESTEEQRRYLENLIKTVEPEVVDTELPHISEYSVFYKTPEDLWYITYEVATLKDENINCSVDIAVEVVPVKQDEYHKIKNNPFRGASDKRVLRVDTGSSILEIVSKYKIIRYFIKYISKPKPIILVDITNDGLSINNETKPMTCMLNTALHRLILERAVSIAIKRLPQGNV